MAPVIKLVSDQTAEEREGAQQERAREEAEERIEWALRDLAANVMRVARGAGKPEMLPHQAADFVRAVTAHSDVAGNMPLAQLYSDALSLGEDPSSGADAHHYGKRAIVRGSLQMVASHLLDQRTQEAAGEEEMYRGLAEIEAARAEARKEWSKKVPKGNAAREKLAWDAALAAWTPKPKPTRRKD